MVLCGVQGEVSVHSYDSDIQKRDLMYFKLNLEKGESVQLIAKSPEENLIIFVTGRYSSTSRLLVYSYKDGEMSYASEWRVEQSLMGQEDRKPI